MLPTSFCASTSQDAKLKIVTYEIFKGTTYTVKKKKIFLD